LPVVGQRPDVERFNGVARRVTACNANTPHGDLRQEPRKQHATLRRQFVRDVGRATGDIAA
jgi:hypothetical protein